MHHAYLKATKRQGNTPKKYFARLSLYIVEKSFLAAAMN